MKIISTHLIARLSVAALLLVGIFAVTPNAYAVDGRSGLDMAIADVVGSASPPASPRLGAYLALYD